MTYVEDVVQAFLRAGANPAADGEIFNLGGERISLRALVELLIELAGQGSFRLVPFPPEKKAIDIGSFYADDRKIRAVLGWKPRSNEDALAATAGGAIEDLPRDLAGWRIASIAFVRVRVTGERPGDWAAQVEYQVKMLAA